LQDVQEALAAVATTQQTEAQEQQTKVLREETEQTLIIPAPVVEVQVPLDRTRSQQMLAAMVALA
jgi:hypothetical protein